MRKLVAAFLLLAGGAAAQPTDARQQLIAYLNGIGMARMEERARTVAAISTREQADERKAAVRQKILNLVGGLPERRGPVAVKQFGSLAGEGFRVEKIAYESLPGLYVTADLYVPLAGAGPFPAVLLTPGHEPTGKLGQYNWGANLARAGIVAFAVDPMGQGERLQHYDPELEDSKVGQGTGEHGHAALSTMLIGEHVARYFINDGMRALDYLTSRKDVDAAHLGAFGCSGGGTATAYLAALDDRIQVAATACYITSFQELLPTAGPQEAEQSIPRFLTEGLDFGDWVELAAPKPYAIVSTTNDMFPFAGARQTYEEAKRIYGLYGAGDKLQWITGPGGHGALAPIAPQIFAFLVHALKNGAVPPEFRDFIPERRDDLLCTKTGQLSTSLGGETVESINRRRAQSVMARKRSASASDIRAVTWAVAQPGDPAPSVRLIKTEEQPGYRLDTISLETEPGIELAGVVAIPSGAAAKPAVLLVTAQPKETLASGPDIARLAKAGRVVLVLQARGTPLTGTVTPSLLGPYNLIAVRALVVGKTLVGMRVDDLIRAVTWLAARPDVDREAITVYGSGPAGVAVLHAAALDSRIAHVVVENTLISYRDAIERPLHRNLADVALPGVLQHYDLPDLIVALRPRTVKIVNPVDALGHPARDYHLDGVRVVSRSPREPLPLD